LSYTLLFSKIYSCRNVLQTFFNFTKDVLDEKSEGDTLLGQNDCIRTLNTLFELYLQTLAIEALFACDEESAIWHRKLKILLYAPSGFRTYLLSQQT
jgi:hypothetical protein